MARDCRSKPPDQGNSAIVEEEPSWDVLAIAAHVEDEGKSPFIVTTEEKCNNRPDDLVADSEVSNHLISGEQKPRNSVEHESSGAELSGVYHVPGMKKTLVSVPQITKNELVSIVPLFFMLLAVAIGKGWNLWQIDVNNAFEVRTEEGKELPDPTIYRKMMLKYVKSTVSCEVAFKRGNKQELVGYCDTDYANDLYLRRCTTGHVFMYGSGPVSWCSKRQTNMSLSTTEAEYRVAAMAAQECMWPVRLLEELNQRVNCPVKLNCDNGSAIKLAENPTFHARTKHIEVHCHYVREKVKIKVKHVDTTEMVVDVLTKGMSNHKLGEFRRAMGLLEVKIEREC